MNTIPLPRLRLSVAVVLAMLTALVLAGPAAAAGKKKPEKPWNNPNKAVAYEGTTASGHKITFALKKNRLYDMESGIAVSCIAIQGSDAPTGGVETFSYSGYVPLGPSGVDFTFMKKPAVYRRNGAISGKQRIQYEYFLPTFPMPTFVIYSCLGEGSFAAKPVLK